MAFLHIKETGNISPQNALENLAQALAVIADKDEKIDAMAARIAQLERLLFGLGDPVKNGSDLNTLTPNFLCLS